MLEAGLLRSGPMAEAEERRTMAYGSARVPRGAFLLGALAAGLGPLGAVLEAPSLALASGSAAALRRAARLGPLINIQQTWNNCGPATVAEVLAYWGIAKTQGQVQSVLRVDGPSAGMTPYGIPTYAQSLGLRTLSGVGGSAALVKGLIAGGFPVIVHQVVSLADLTGHWRPIEAYDDLRAVFVASDPYLGPDHAIGYGDFARIWALRGQAFAVLYPASHQAAVSSIVAASGWDRAAAYAEDLALVRAGQLDASPAGTPANAQDGYRALAMAWDAAQLGRSSTARTYLGLATSGGANPIEIGWVARAIR